ncbi:MAG: sigma-70 family RNA polymerase sigma factor [Planctomycetes bacterium]|nr:sigma-70 family RNA polymerase sigma factor [Planctomycetota bacterium]
MDTPPELRFVTESPQLRGYLLALTGDAHLADDLLQECFLIVRRRAAEFRPEGDFGAWCRGIARNLAREAARARRRGPLGLPEDVVELLADAAPPPSDADQQLEAIRACLQRLSPRARELLSLRHVDGLPPRDIATRVGWSVNAVSVAITRALGSLRGCVAAQGDAHG